MSLRLRIPLALLLAAVLAAAGAASAHAASPEVGIADDRIMQWGGADADQAVAEWRAQGVNGGRIVPLGSKIAPPHYSVRPPAGFNPADPNSPRYVWGQLD